MQWNSWQVSLPELVPQLAQVSPLLGRVQIMFDSIRRYISPANQERVIWLVSTSNSCLVSWHPHLGGRPPCPGNKALSLPASYHHLHLLCASSSPHSCTAPPTFDH